MNTIGVAASGWGRCLQAVAARHPPPPVPPLARRTPRRLICRSSTATATSNGGSQQPPPHFSDLPLVRAGHLRSQEGELQRLAAEPGSRCLLMHQNKLLVVPADGSSSGVSSNAKSDGVLDLQVHSFAAAGATAPGGGTPRWLPLVARTQQVSQLAAGGGERQAEGPALLFLGLDSAGTAAFAAQVPPHLLPLLPPLPPPRGSSPADQPAVPASGSGQLGEWVDVRNGGAQMTAHDAAVAALAAGLVSWHSSAAFCSRTGAPTVVSGGGHSRTPVAAPGASGRPPRAVYPRVDPAVLVAAACGDWLLLGRKAAWAPGRYSCLAGFLEVGETLEQAAAREVEEESGVRLDPSAVRYHSSQPWPFPQSLMVGFIAQAPPAPDASGPGAAAAPPRRGLSLLERQGAVAACGVGLLPSEAERYLLPRLQPVQVDTNELEHACWLHADWLAAQLAAAKGEPRALALLAALVRGGGGGDEPPFRIPGEHAMANRVIRSWLHERQAAAAGGEGGEGGEAASELAALAAVPDVSIDQGSFKYVLLRLSTADGLHSKLLVRGDSRAAYHNHIFTQTAAELRAVAPEAGLKLETLGGGRIEHHPEQRVALVFGYSSAFGQAPHDVTAALLRRWLPFHDVSVSYDGY